MGKTMARRHGKAGRIWLCGGFVFPGIVVRLIPFTLWAQWPDLLPCFFVGASENIYCAYIYNNSGGQNPARRWQIVFFDGK